MWKDIRKEKPDDGQIVLIHQENGHIQTWPYIPNFFETIKVTHWMDVPPPPVIDDTIETKNNREGNQNG